MQFTVNLTQNVFLVSGFDPAEFIEWFLLQILFLIAFRDDKIQGEVIEVSLGLCENTYCGNGQLIKLLKEYSLAI